MLLAARGGHVQIQEALALLERNPSSSAGPEDQRARAVVLAARPAGRREAIRLLEELHRQQALTPDDQLMLARLHEASGDRDRARERLRSLVTAHADNALYLSQYVLLLPSGNRDEVRQALARLEKLEPQSFRTVEVKARVLRAQGRADEAAELLRAFARTKDAPLPRLAALLEELDLMTAAGEVYRRHAEASNQPEPLLLLARFLARQRKVGEGLDLCEKAGQTASTEPVASALLYVARLGHADEEQLQRVERWLRPALDQHPKSLLLLGCLADLYELQGRHAHAQALYRQVLAREPKHVRALNNLACQLALQSDRQDEALALIEQAIALDGPEAALLDTRAVVQLTRGHADLAIRDLEEAVAQAPTAVRYFHLAQAHQQGGDRRAAEQAWRRSRSLGLNPTSLHALERPAYQRLEREVGRQ